MKIYGRARAFYTPVGDRNVILPDIPSLDYGDDKKDDNKVSAACQTHVPNGILWVLGLIGDDSTP